MITGIIASQNDNGIKLQGETEWRNYTQPQWREDIWHPHKVGDRVQLGMDEKTGKFIRSVEVLNERDAHWSDGVTDPFGSGEPALDPSKEPDPTYEGGGATGSVFLDKDTQIARAVALKAAVDTYAAHPPADGEGHLIGVPTADTITNRAAMYFEWLTKRDNA